MAIGTDAKRFRRLVCGSCGVFAVLTAMAPVQTSVGSIKLWPAAVVVEDSIRLGDVAELRGFDLESEPSLSDLVINSAPEPGGSRVITLTAVREALGTAGVNRASVIVKGAAECAVRRPVQTAAPPPASHSPVESHSADEPVRTRTLRDAVLSYFDDQMTAYDGRAEVDFGRTSVQMLDLAEPQFHFRINRRSGPSIGLIHVEAVVLRGAQAVQRIPMVVNVTLVRDVVVARKAINRDATVRAEDVHAVPWRFTRADRTGLTDPGEGGNAARLAALDTASSDVLGNLSVFDFFNNIAGDAAVTSAAARSGAEAAEAIVSSLRAEKESISGVSLDEEAIELLKFERAFQGAARYVSMVDQMLDEMMALVR